MPRENILSQRYTQASTAFLTTDRTDRAQNLRQLPPGKCVSTYHVGDYPSIGRSYERLLDYCRKHRLRLISDSYEFCVNDYITTQVAKRIYHEDPVLYPAAPLTGGCPPDRRVVPLTGGLSP